MWISDRINWITSKRAKPIFFKITSNQSIYHDKSNDVKFGFGVDLLNMMDSAVGGGEKLPKLNPGLDFLSYDLL